MDAENLYGLAQTGSPYRYATLHTANPVANPANTLKAPSLLRFLLLNTKIFATPRESHVSLMMQRITVNTLILRYLALGKGL